MARKIGASFIIAIIFAIVAPSQTRASETFVTFDSPEGTKIPAVYVEPQSPSATPVPGIVMLHGCGGLFSKSGEIGKRERAWIDILKAEGWAILLPDSFGPRGHRTVCTLKDRSITPRDHRQYDALGALKFMQSLPGVDPQRIALMGWSNGAMTGLHAVMTGSPAAPSEGTSPDFMTSVLYYPGCIAIGKEFPDYTFRVPTLIQHGADDNWTLPKPCRRLVERAQINGGQTIEIDFYNGAVHGFDHPSSDLKTRNIPSKSNPVGGKDVWVGTHPESREKAIARTMAWLRERLK